MNNSELSVVAEDPIPNPTITPFADSTALTNTFEFWPAWTIHIPMYLIGVYQGIRLGNLNFFPAVNPGMANGGLFLYSKFDSLAVFAPRNIPKSILSKSPHQPKTLLQNAESSGFAFPMIFKPDIGERGRGVKLIRNEKEAEIYLRDFKDESVIVQEFISKSEEYGVFIQKDPSTRQIKVTSITQKIPLQVVGNGRDNVLELAQNHPRAKRYLAEIKPELLEIVPASGKLLQLSIKGNHCKGAAFVDRSQLICSEIMDAFQEICGHVEDFYYGRLDVKVNTSTDLKKPDEILILEVNGANSEPIHIYSHGKTYLSSIREIARYFQQMATIARSQLSSIRPEPKLKDLLRNFWLYRQLIKNTHE
ncbi:ATP-grasp domain-containing protein [Algoriphagus litoralis]|uniref:ATP-grasp domain-containing protein n=1 Tax=Algoriphagus litoralis TaxID=2202829 RepID=UPI000DBAC6F9|nr:ATP-grasp domain-containing protein [Algoriphagus litoralis]